MNRYVATYGGPGGLWHASPFSTYRNGVADTLCGLRAREVDHDASGDPLPAVLDNPGEGQVVECRRCYRLLYAVGVEWTRTA